MTLEKLIEIDIFLIKACLFFIPCFVLGFYRGWMAHKRSIENDKNK